jgi:WD40 repeat protein
VQFNGIGDRAISGGKDKKVMGWLTAGFENPLINQNTGTIAELDKAVRLVRYRPVNNDAIAVGLENGEIQLWSLLPTSRRLQTFAYAPEDRVFDLIFTPDSRTLFSGHGSGSVVQWNLPLDLASAQPTIARQKQVGFAVNALKLVGDTDSYLAIGGRFKQLVLWDLQKDKVRPIRSGGSGAGNYILSLAVPSHKPYLLASADNQGTIRIWNLRTCLTSNGDCEIVNEWQPDTTIHGIAFSADGCYLASAGQDGRTMLWELNAEGKPRNQKMNGIELARSSLPVNSVDVMRQQDDLLVINAGDNTQVELYRKQNASQDCH